MTTLYEKRGRRYVPVSSYFGEGRSIKTGGFRLTYCYRDGARRYEYDVTPATAPFVAAAMIARTAMEEAIYEKAIAKEHIKNLNGVHVPYTKKQLAILKRFRKEMSDAGGLLPNWWDHASSYEISEAAIKAVQEYRP